MLKSIIFFVVLVVFRLLAATSKEGISYELKEDETSGLPLEDLSDDDDEINGEEISLNTEDDSLTDKIKSINVENSYNQEKETAIEM